ncbi:hypothetical protein [Sphingobacterium sp. MYb382]|uniref:hypothetical protein n=1 Tax=Sphingobacterium sp. MYb382 TaxID=2745278 RepID=UPI0030B67A40
MIVYSFVPLGKVIKDKTDMANTASQRPAKTTDNNANRTEYYVTLTVAIVIGLVGVFIRFVPDVITALDQHTTLFSALANILVIIAAIIAFKVVFGILGFGKNRD